MSITNAHASYSDQSFLRDILVIMVLDSRVMLLFMLYWPIVFNSIIIIPNGYYLKIGHL